MKIIVALFILTSTLFLVTTCCDDCPNCPQTEEQDHLFYVLFNDTYGIAYVKVFSVEKNDFIDSIGIGIRASYIDIVGNGEYLVLSGLDGFRQIDLKTKEVVYENPVWEAIIEVSPDSKYIRVFDSQQDKVEIRRLTNFSLVFSDTLTEVGGFSQDSKFYAYPRKMQDGTGLSELMIYDIHGDSVINKGLLHYWNDVPLYLLFVEIDSRNNKVFFAGGPGGVVYLFSYDLQTEEVNPVMPLDFNSGLIIQLDPNLDILYATSLTVPPPGTIGDDSLYIFSTETDELIQTIATTTEDWHHAPFIIAVTKDSRYVCTSTLNLYDEGFVVYDALYRTPLTYVRIPTHYALFVSTDK